MHKTCADGGPRPPKPKPSVVPFDYRPVIRGRGTNEKVDLTQLILEWEQKLADVDAPAAVCGWCKEDMVIKRNTKVYCSARCRVAHKRWMDKHPGEPDPSLSDVTGEWWGMWAHSTPHGHLTSSDGFDSHWLKNEGLTNLPGPIYVEPLDADSRTRSRVISADWASDDYWVSDWWGDEAP